MRLSKLFGKTWRETPSATEAVSHQLLLKSAMIYQLTAGVYALLPLGKRVISKIEKIIRQEIEAIGGEEVALPVLQPFELWESTGRHLSFGKSLFTLKDRRGHRLSLGPTHEEVITDLVKNYLQSYRELPLRLYQIQTKFRDEPRPRGGLLRVREFSMMDLYSFDRNEEDLNQSYQEAIETFQRIFHRCGFDTIVVEADSGAIGGKESHEFMVIAPSGEDEVIICPNCHYSANVEKAQAIKSQGVEEEPLPLEEIATPGIKTIEELTQFLHLPKNKTLKAVFYSADGEVVFVLIRGDLEVNEVKLKNALKCHELALASDEQVKRAALVAGSASPLGLSGIKVVADDSILLGSNFVAGANKPDYHLKNVNYPRDFQVDLLTDIALARPGQKCPRCQHELTSQLGIELGHTFKLGTLFSEKIGAFFIDKDGKRKPVVMGCYGIGIGRIMASAIEQGHDEKGIIWPISLTPYHVYLSALGMEELEIAEEAEKLYRELESAGIEVLFDDRLESPGVKFNDADLLGIPLRLVLSRRTLKKQSVELKWRSEKESILVPCEEIIAQLKRRLSLS
jgi:prolyl-tRNA synthetase